MLSFKKPFFAMLGLMLLLSLVTPAPVLAQPSPEQAPPVDGPDLTILQKATAADNFTKFVAAVREAGVADLFEQDGPYTVFIPTDAAFAKLSDERREELFAPENKAELAKILKYHVVPGRFALNESALTTRDLELLSTSDRLETMEGYPLSIDPAETGFYVGEAAIVEPDIPATNGMIHAIDTVLMPPSESAY